jgi:hypothetical protein
VKARVQCSANRLETNQRQTSQTALAETDARVLVHTNLPETPKNFNSSIPETTGTVSRVPFLLSYTSAEPGKPNDFARALKATATMKGNSDKGVTADDADLDGEPFQPFPIFPPFFAAELFQFDITQDSSSLSDLSLQSDNFPNRYNGVYKHKATEMISFLEDFRGRALVPSRDLITALLTPTNLAVCLDTYIRNGHRHIPIIHKSCLKVESMELTLLLAVFVVGAVWSYPRDTYFTVLNIVEMTERSIFEGNLFKRLQKHDSRDVAIGSPGVLSVLQAATLLISISFAFPSVDVRRRFRNQRFTDLVSVVRLLDVNTNSSAPGLTTADVASFDWSGYVARESCNRCVQSSNSSVTLADEI